MENRYLKGFMLVTSLKQRVTAFGDFMLASKVLFLVDGTKVITGKSTLAKTSREMTDKDNKIYLI